jgi:hypothetical protein
MAVKTLQVSPPGGPKTIADVQALLKTIQASSLANGYDVCNIFRQKKENG